MTYFDDTAYLFRYLLREFAVNGVNLVLTYNGADRPIVKTAQRRAYVMEMNGMQREITELLCDCLRDDYTYIFGTVIQGIRSTGLYDAWSNSSQDKRPTVTMEGDEYQAFDILNDSSDACVKLTLRLKQ